MSDDLIISTKIAAISNEVAKLNAENAKLRAALEEIIQQKILLDENGCSITPIRIASEALKGMG